jgi:transketolase
MSKYTQLDHLSVNTLRALAIDMVQKANSGHPGLPLGAAPMAYVLWTRYLNHNPKNPNWYNRDRFVLSAGHGSALLYALLHLTGYDLPMEQLKQFRQWGSMTPGHPEYHDTPGVEITTGPLGQGVANSVGMAIAEANLSARFNRSGSNIIDHYTYCLAGDGCLMEGVASEATSLAGHLGLGKLILFYDDNQITLSAATQLAFTEDRQMRFESYGWHTLVVKDGNNLDEIDTAIQAARAEKNRPTIILVRTVIGFGSPHKHDTYEVHGSPLGVEEVKLTKEILGVPEDSAFYIPKEVSEHMQQASIQKGEKLETSWNMAYKNYESHYPDVAKEFTELMRNQLPENWNKNIETYPADAKGMSTRVAGGKVMQAICVSLPGLIGGSADLNPSTFTEMINFGNFQSATTDQGDRQGSLDGGWNFAGRNIFFGVREHAMGAIANGIATYQGMIPYTATFMTFSDYMRPAMRLAALMHMRVIFVFTHDSIALGEDGPTHQPIEQLSSLRAIPNMLVIRPCDANETAVAWECAIETLNQPTSLILSRQNLPILDRSKYAAANNLKKGAYILADAANGQPDVILMASGSEVNLIVKAQEMLLSQNVHARIVSFPSMELFKKQSEQYQESVLPKSIKKRLAVEAGISQGWWRYIGNEGDMISIEKFGASAPGDKVMAEYGFTADNVCKRVLALLGKN